MGFRAALRSAQPLPRAIPGPRRAASTLKGGLSLAGLLWVLLLVACAPQVRRFPLSPPLWIDPDQASLSAPPAKYYSGLIADGADQIVLRPLAELFAFHDPGEAINVNALDEVPGSSWFQNRIGLFPMSPEEVARGPCKDTIDTSGPWTVFAAKPNGANPGFFIRTPEGRRYLLKGDGALQPERNTAADVIGSKFYYAAGYNVPCYQIATFDPRILVVDPQAMAEDELGRPRPMTPADVSTVISACARSKEGLYRAGMSEFVDGKPIGPFRYEGTRADDHNDVIDHRDRRELRGAKVLAAFLGHFDSREQNSLDVWTKDNYVRHYYIDFGSSFGSRWPIDAMSRRLGFSYYFDVQHVAEDLVSLGLLYRPWDHLQINPGSEIFGYFEDQRFGPTEWRGGYPNPAFQRATRRDQLWMARILSRFTPEHIAAIVKSARLSEPRGEAWLIQTLIGRRQRVLEDAFLRDDPLDHWQLVRRTPGDPAQSLCFEDLAIKHGLVDATQTTYKLRFYGGEGLADFLGWLQFPPDPGHPERSCVLLPIGYRRPSQLASPGAPEDDPARYGVLKVFVHHTRSFWPSSGLNLHFYDLGPEKGYVLVGLERPEKIEIPSDY